MNARHTNSSKIHVAAVILLACLFLLTIHTVTNRAIVAQAVPLQVTSTHPQNGATEITTDGEIVVIFNRPVVPLTGIDEQAALPQPLTIEPIIEGVGSWLNTSVYTFRPVFGVAGGIAGGIEYTVTVADVVGLDGETLAAPYLFTFSTSSPTVVAVSPDQADAKPDTGRTRRI